jgi:thiol-disulfide isomerase/thioredoxin
MLSQVYLFISDKPLNRIDSILNKFEGDAKNSVYYNSVASTQQKIKALLPGNVAPDFTLLQRDSSKFNLSSMRGNYAMIDFWASWCHPCRQAIPHWKEVYQKYHAKGFGMVSVSDDARWKDWFKAMDQEKMPWHQVCDEFPVENMPARVGELYMTTYIPFYVLLDKDGKILVYSGKEEDIDKKLKEIFGS